MAGLHFPPNSISDRNSAHVEKTTNIYYGPCRKSLDLVKNVKPPNCPRGFLKNHNLKPEPNYILLGEVEKELKAVKEKRRNNQVKPPQQLNVSNLLEELVSSKKWQILNSSCHVYGGAKKKPAPQPPTKQQQQHINVKNQISKPLQLPIVSNNLRSQDKLVKDDSEAFQKADQGFDDYLNATEIHKLWQTDSKCTYDTIKWSEHDTPLGVNFPSPAYSTTPLVPPTDQMDVATCKPSSHQKNFSGNFLLQSRQEVEKSMKKKRSDTSGLEGTIKLLPSDIRKHRVWLSLNPGIKANQATLGSCSSSEDNPPKVTLRPISPWNGFHHTKDPFPKARGPTEGRKSVSADKNRWQNKIVKKSSKICGVQFHVQASWLTATIAVSISIGFIFGFMAAWFGKSTR